MQFFRLIRPGAAFTAVTPLLIPTGAHAGAGSAIWCLPTLLAKAWFLGYALVFLAILLGLLAVLIPSMRKTLRKK